MGRNGLEPGSHIFPKHSPLRMSSLPLLKFLKAPCDQSIMALCTFYWQYLFIYVYPVPLRISYYSGLIQDWIKWDVITNSDISAAQYKFFFSILQSLMQVSRNVFHLEIMGPGSLHCVTLPGQHIISWATAAWEEKQEVACWLLNASTHELHSHLRIRTIYLAQSPAKI